MALKNPTRVDVFLEEYSRDDVIAKYLHDTAGAGIAWALTHAYAPVYLDVVKALMMHRPAGHSFRVLEYGCGGGMNLVKLVELLRRQGATIDAGLGVDFSPRMIEAARKNASEHLPSDLARQISFAVASNETLARDLVGALACAPSDVANSFDIIVGVNTFRYCHRLKKENDCAGQIFSLLRPGGYSIMIDMNKRFPLFRSKLSDLRSGRPKEEYYLPSLAEYSRPFQHAGFTIVDRRNFCWVPHSASPALLALCRMVSPILDLGCSPFAMRSLVIAQKPPVA